MVVRSSSTAQIHLILASDDRSEVRQIERDLKASNYVYAFAHIDESGTVLHAVRRHILGNHMLIPTVVVVNYNFAEQECTALLEFIRTAAEKTPVKCVVTHPPADDNVRERLTALGARLFDEDEELALASMSVH